MSYHDEQEAIGAFIENEMDLYMAKSDSEKMDLIVELVENDKIQVNDIIEYFEVDVLHYFSEQWRPGR